VSRITKPVELTGQDEPVGTLQVPGAARPADQAPSGRLARLPGPDSLWWIAAVAVAFTGVQLLVMPLRLGLSWDEVVYVSQIGGHAPAAFFDPARSRGVTLLVAPVTLITSSIAVLRAYLAVASGLALFGSLLAWRKLRPAWILALAGIAFGGLWVTQFYGPQAMPDEWMAFAALAAVGLFLRAAGPTGRETGAVADGAEGADGVETADGAEAADGRDGAPARTRRWPLLWLAIAVAAATLTRPGDAVFLVAALLIAALGVRAWRQWPLVAAVAVGFALGAAEWVAEAYLRFGGPLARLHLASAEQGGFGLHLGMWAELRAASGPTLCRPCTVGWRYPEVGLWLALLPLLVALGVIVARRADRFRSSLLAAVTALALASQYLIGIDYAAPRFMIPAYALAAIPVADLLAWLLVTARVTDRPWITALVSAVLVAQVGIQEIVFAHEVAGTVTFHADYATAAADLGQLGIRPPCLINGAQRIPIAFYAGCASTPNAIGARPPAAPEARPGGHFAVLTWGKQSPPPFAARWRKVTLTGTGKLTLVAYLPPA
jgi:hypothetical protein